MFQKLIAICLSTFVLTACVHADEASVKKAVEARLSDAKIRSVHKAPLGDLYEVVTENDLFYTDAKVSFFFVGNLIDAKTMHNLTADRVSDMRRVHFDKLPFDWAIKTVKGNGKRQLALFSDPDCPYCKGLEKELAKVDNVTVYTFLYPIVSLHPDANNKAKAVWCSKDRAKTWDDLMLKGTVPSGKTDCDNPIEKIAKLGRSLNFTGTPTLVFADGHVVPGMIPADKLEQMLDAANKGGK